MKHHQLRALVALAQHGSIHAAARSLCVTQPAVTKALRELEADVGVPLLSRNSWGGTVTEQGQVLLSRARLIVHELGRAEEEMAQLRGRKGAQLRVGVSPMVGFAVLPAAFARFRRGMRDVQVDFLEYPNAQLLEGLRNGLLDFALSGFNEARGEPFLVHTRLLSFPRAFAVRRGSPLAGSTTLAQLQQAEWLHGDAGDDYPLYVRQLFASRQLDPPRLTRCTSNVLFSGLLFELDAVAPLSQLSLQSRLTADMLQPLALPEQPPDLHLALLVREGAILTQAADYLIQCVRQVAQGLAGTMGS